MPSTFLDFLRTKHDVKPKVACNLQWEKPLCQNHAQVDLYHMPSIWTWFFLGFPPIFWHLS